MLSKCHCGFIKISRSQHQIKLQKNLKVRFEGSTSSTIKVIKPKKNTQSSTSNHHWHPPHSMQFTTHAIFSETITPKLFDMYARWLIDDDDPNCKTHHFNYSQGKYFITNANHSCCITAIASKSPNFPPKKIRRQALNWSN